MADATGLPPETEIQILAHLKWLAKYGLLNEEGTDWLLELTTKIPNSDSIAPQAVTKNDMGVYKYCRNDQADQNDDQS